MTTIVKQKKGRLQLALAVAAALGCSSATFSGVLGTFALQQPVGSQASIA